MENKRQVGSSSSFTADLFGTKEPPTSSSTGIFASIFPPPSMVLDRSSSRSEVMGSWQKQQSPNQTWDTIQGKNPAPGAEGASHNINKEDNSYMYQEERVNPCHLSSSLYYGGQDNYSKSTSSKNFGSYPTIKKDDGQDDPNANNSNDASRGNWWQGSLYY
ncbi:hypothetical protein CFOL_v3_21788 [Cephalotus follicularis]|uniref:Uncharacterized protein n=1 Tax=Cephalotus follicularis TaxID=3775 RepID=A0A1Q3CDK8_CEPFO|nr:hypothetical protein CFOL_v3_21788 [Cephalotus follicularis]